MKSPGADLRTILLLAFRHLMVRRGRAVVLLFGYAVGVGVMMVLLSVGEAMLVQSKDVSLVGGGQITVLPEGIDLEGLRTGSMSGLFFAIDRARFLERQLIGGKRLDDVVAAVSPVIEHKLMYLEREGRLIPLRVGGELPSGATAVGAGLSVLGGSWRDDSADARFARPTPQQLYDEIDHFHPPMPDSTWAEWHYFNLAPAADEWWYITYLIGGPLAEGKGGGQLLVTRHRRGRPPARFEARFRRNDIIFDTATADLSIGANTVAQRDGRYHIVGRAAGPTGTVRFDLVVRPTPNAYFPPVELRGDQYLSGYVVPAVRGTAAGTICEGADCRGFDEVAAYHDHNWGVWRGTVWNWGQARGRVMSLVYGGVITTESLSARSAAPYFLAAVDSQGTRQILRFGALEYHGAHPVPGAPGLMAPDSFRFRAARDPDTVEVTVRVLEAQVTAAGIGGDRVFLQMRGAFKVRGRLLGTAVADSGLGFFETFVGRNP